MRKIIHVDISEFFKKQVKTFLSEQGILSESFSRGADALNAIDNETALILTGMTLSDMDGEDFVKKVSGSPYNIPVIALTSDQEPNEEHLWQNLGIKAHILKSGTWMEKLLPYLDKYFI